MNMLTLMLPWLLLTHNVVDFYNNGASDRYVECLNQVVTTYVDQLEHSNAIRLTNKTGWMDESGIHQLGLQFDSRDHVDLAGARHMMLGLIESFLDAINACPDRKPYLSYGPLTSCHLEIRVQFIDDCQFSYPLPTEIKYMIFREGKISYYLGNPRILGNIERLRDEPLSLARQIDASLGSPVSKACHGRFLPPH